MKVSEAERQFDRHLDDSYPDTNIEGVIFTAKDIAHADGDVYDAMFADWCDDQEIELDADE